MGRARYPDPETPVGSRGVGEAPVGAGFGAIVNAISAAVGDEVFRRAPVTADMILMALEARPADARTVDGEHLVRRSSGLSVIGFDVNQ